MKKCNNIQQYLPQAIQMPKKTIKRISKKSIQSLPKVSIIILNYNGIKFMKKLIASLKQLNYPKNKYNIIIVDNASSDGSMEFVEDNYNNYQNIRIIKNKKNLGFSKGNNIGIKASRSPYVFVLNNDSRVHKNTLRYLVETMEAHKGAASCGTEECYYNENIRNPKGPIRETVWNGGGATIYRSKALKEVGMFDETFFADYEDVDLSFRLRLNGWKTYQNHKALWYHAGKDSRRKFGKMRLIRAWRNRLFVLIKFASLPQLFRSLYLYAFSPEKRHSRINMSIRKRVRRIGLILISSLFILPYLPEMIYKRGIIQRKISKKGNLDVDSWIRYIDKSFFR